MVVDFVRRTVELAASKCLRTNRPGRVLSSTAATFCREPMTGSAGIGR